MNLITDILRHYSTAIDRGFGLLTPDVSWLLNVLIVLNVVWSAAMWALSSDEVVVKLARKVVYVGIFVWLVQTWPTLTETLGRSFMYLGFKAGGVGFPRDYVPDPGNIALRGLTASEPIMRAIEDMTGPVAFFENFIQIVLFSLAVAALLIAFFVIAIQVIVSLLTFKFGTLVAFVLVPFGVLRPTSFIAERPLGWVVSSAVRLMVLTLVTGLGDAIFGSMQLDAVTVRQALEVALAAVVLMVLSIVATRMASDLVTGGPSLGAGDAVGAAGGAGGVIYGGAQYGYGAGRGAASALSSAGLAAVRAASAVKSGGATVAAGAAAAAAGVTSAAAGGSAHGSAAAGASSLTNAGGGPPAGSPTAGRSPTAPPAGPGTGGPRGGGADPDPPPTATSPGGHARAMGASRVRDGARTLGSAGGGGGGMSAAGGGNGGGDGDE